METLDTPYFGIRESASRLGISRTTLYQWIHEDKVRARQNSITGKWEISKEELYFLMRERDSR